MDGYFDRPMYVLAARASILSGICLLVLALVYTVHSIHT